MRFKICFFYFFLFPIFFTLYSCQQDQRYCGNDNCTQPLFLVETKNMYSTSDRNFLQYSDSEYALVFSIINATTLSELVMVEAKIGEGRQGIIFFNNTFLRATLYNETLISNQEKIDIWRTLPNVDEIIQQHKYLFLKPGQESSRDEIGPSDETDYNQMIMERLNDNRETPLDINDLKEMEKSPNVANHTLPPIPNAEEVEGRGFSALKKQFVSNHEIPISNTTLNNTISNAIEKMDNFNITSNNEFVVDKNEPINTHTMDIIKDKSKIDAPKNKTENMIEEPINLNSNLNVNKNKPQILDTSIPNDTNSMDNSNITSSQIDSSPSKENVDNILYNINNNKEDIKILDKNNVEINERLDIDQTLKPTKALLEDYIIEDVFENLSLNSYEISVPSVVVSNEHLVDKTLKETNQVLASDEQSNQPHKIVKRENTQIESENKQSTNDTIFSSSDGSESLAINSSAENMENYVLPSDINIKKIDPNMNNSNDNLATLSQNQDNIYEYDMHNTLINESNIDDFVESYSKDQSPNIEDDPIEMENTVSKLPNNLEENASLKTDSSLMTEHLKYNVCQSHKAPNGSMIRDPACHNYMSQSIMDMNSHLMDDHLKLSSQNNVIKNEINDEQISPKQMDKYLLLRMLDKMTDVLVKIHNKLMLKIYGADFELVDPLESPWTFIKIYRDVLSAFFGTFGVFVFYMAYRTYNQRENQQLQEAIGNLFESQNKIKDYEELNQAQINKIKELEESLDETRIELELRQCQLREIKTQLCTDKELTQELELAQNEIKELLDFKTKYEEVSQELETLQTTKNDVERELNQLKQEMERLKDTNTNLKLKLKDESNTLLELKNESDKYKIECEQHISECQRLTNLIDTYRILFNKLDLTQIKSDDDNLIEGVEGWDVDLEKPLNIDSEKMQQLLDTTHYIKQIDELTQQIDELKQKASTYDIEKMELKNALTKRDLEYNSLKNRTETMEKDNKELEGKMAFISKYFEDKECKLQKSINELTSECGKQKQTIKEMEKKYDHLMKQADVYLESLDESKDDYKELQRDMKQRIIDIEDHANKLKMTAHSFERKANNLQVENHTLRQMLTELEKNLEKTTGPEADAFKSKLLASLKLVQQNASMLPHSGSMYGGMMEEHSSNNPYYPSNSMDNNFSYNDKNNVNNYYGSDGNETHHSYISSSRKSEHGRMKHSKKSSSKSTKSGKVETRANLSMNAANIGGLPMPPNLPFLPPPPMPPPPDFFMMAGSTNNGNTMGELKFNGPPLLPISSTFPPSMIPDTKQGKNGVKKDKNLMTAKHQSAFSSSTSSLQSGPLPITHHISNTSNVNNSTMNPPNGFLPFMGPGPAGFMGMPNFLPPQPNAETNESCSKTKKKAKKSKKDSNKLLDPIISAAVDNMQDNDPLQNNIESNGMV